MSDLIFNLTEGDDHPSLEFQLLAPPADPEASPGDYDIPDLTGATVKLTYKVGNTKYARTCVVVDVGTARCRYDWTSADKALLVGPATYRAKARAYMADGTKLTFPNEKGKYIQLVVDEAPE